MREINGKLIGNINSDTKDIPVLTCYVKQTKNEMKE